MRFLRVGGIAVFFVGILTAIQGCTLEDAVKALLVLLALSLPGVVAGGGGSEANSSIPVLACGFGIAGTFDTNVGSSFAVTADFDKDGHLDLAVATNPRSSLVFVSTPTGVSILLGNGKGSFTKKTDIILGQSGSTSVPTGVTEITAGDFNEDGNPDIAAGFGPGQIRVLLGDGTGNFSDAAGSPISTNTQVNGLIMGDFDNDSHQDLAFTTGPTSVHIFLGNGDGTFTVASGSPFSAGGSNAAFIAIGRFNADFNEDIVVSNLNSANVSVFTGNGDGTFNFVSTIAVVISATSMTTADFSNDGFIDIAVSNSGASGNSISILLGNGSGGFTGPTNVPVGNNPGSPTAIDMNQDGKLDLVAITADDDNAVILFGSGSGGFSAPLDCPVGNFPVSVAVGDYDEDGKPDLAVPNAQDDNVSILLNRL